TEAPHSPVLPLEAESMTIPLSRAVFATATVLALVAGAASREEEQNPTVIPGRVTSEKTGDAVAGATIAIEGTQIGTLAGTDGRYSLTVPAARTGNATVTARPLRFRLGRPKTTLS